ncbi:hypothetical protein DQP55_23345 [Mycolicibacterium sp. GF69]|uniref:ESX-1 secretion-associated protein n=1 Tax=Mycolicibacterium sp. GF69 TaxID=2267251 RepID=UPI000DCD1E87|nr:ESX-1 secretion-associated protein [Mycolicibacterium sp. GF69]RAV06861.1 hypothetical protein DQP55_23345 [Mycolicibacterium sp. GF69]
MDQLYVQTDGVRSYAQIHGQVATGLSRAVGGGAPDAAGVQNSHGAIAAAVSSALSTALNVRHGTMQTTATSGATISDLLQKAAQMYEQGDRAGAEKLRAAAEALDGRHDEQGGSDISGSSGIPGSSGGAGAGNPAAGAGNPAAGASNPAGGQMVGQILGQVGQQVGQLAGSLTAPLMGLAQGLQQVPQQAMQAVQGAAGSARDPETARAEKDEDEHTGEPSDRDSAERPVAAERAEPTAGGASPGEATGAGRAPEAPVAERPRPAPTRPQGD